MRHFDNRHPMTVRQNFDRKVDERKERQKICQSCGWSGHLAFQCDGRALKPGPGLVTPVQKQAFWEKKRAASERKESSMVKGESQGTKVDEKKAGGKPIKIIGIDLKEREENLFHVKLMVKGHVMEAMVDSGAVVNVMQKKWADNHLSGVAYESTNLKLLPAQSF